MADATIANKVQRAQGGSSLTIASGGTFTCDSGSTATFASGLTIPSGGSLTIDSGGSFVRASQKEVSACIGAKAGTTAGWVVNAGDNVHLSTVPASQTGSTLVIPVMGLRVGDTITGFGLIGQIESAGGTVTVDADLRSQTAAAADVTDASVGTITQISVTADTAINATQDKSGLTSVVGSGVVYYIKVTATTGGSTDIALAGYSITVTRG